MKWNFRIIPNKEHAQAIEELKILEETIKASRNFIRQNYQNYFRTKKQLPIYLILGPARFGKTTLLSQAGLDLINSHHQRLNYVAPTKYCSFWFTREALYIDTAGTYTKPDITKPRNDIIWHGFIKLLQKYFGKNSLAGTLIVLDLPTISQDKNLLKKALFCIRERIYETAALVKHLPAHIIFTKCDRIMGFSEFFASFDTDERSQPFGLAFATNNKTDLIADFTSKFNTLIKHLNNRVIENLQKSVRPQERPLIKMFPSQLDHLRQTFIEVISQIPHSDQISLSGLYFTSSIQDGSPIDPIKATLFYVLGLKEKSTYNLEASDNRSYFVSGIFRKIINLPETTKKFRLHLPWPSMTSNIYALLIAGIMVIISSTIGYQSYQKNVAAINQTKLTLQTEPINDANYLYSITNQLKQTAASWWLILGINQTKSLYQSLIKTHQILFVQNLIVQTENYLNTAVKIKEPTNLPKLYQGLQVYLMFGHPEKLDPTYIKHWFNEYWSETVSDTSQKDALRQQLAITLQHKFKAELNQQLVTMVQNHLNNLPPLQLIYLLLESSYSKDQLRIDPTRSISKMYTQEKFYKIYDEAIPDLVTNLPKHDWVLGKLNLQLKPALSPNLIKNLRELYIEQYVLAWVNVINTATKLEDKNLADIAKELTQLVHLLKQIKHQINLNNPPPKLTKEINARLHNLNTVNLTELQNDLDKFTHFLAKITKQHDPAQAAFTTLLDCLKNRSATQPIIALKTLANEQPPMLQTYLSTIADHTWQMLFDMANNHISHAWNDTIIPQYQAALDNKYPLFKESKDDIKIEDFNNLFGPHGIIDSFFNKYIEPFVNIDKTNWTWKSINGQKINFSNTFLEVFLRAALIQKMFYTSNTTDPKVMFTLTPIDMTPNTQNFTLHLDGQKVSFSNSSEDKKAQPLTWPGPNPGSVTMSFVDVQGKYLTVSELGPWAWFRILDKANVTSGNNTKQFELTFDLNGNAAKYTLTTTEPVNPFIPEIISNFRCQEQ